MAVEKAATEAPLDIEVVDERTQEEKARPPAKEPVEKIAETHHAEAEDGLGEEAMKRIKSLKYSFKEAQRQKTQVERERDEAIELVRRIKGENDNLRNQLSTGERLVIDQAQRAGSAEVAAAREAYRRAHESQDIDAIVKAQEDFAKAVAKAERYAGYRPQTPEPGEAPRVPFTPQPQPQAPPEPAPLDERTQAFMTKNPWFGKPGYDAMTTYALHLHADLASRGIMAQGETAEEYWSNIDSSLAERFPEQYGPSAQGNGRPQTKPSGGGAQPRLSPVTVTSGSRTPGGAPQKVRLTQTQVTLARRLGLTNEQYARELLKEEREKANA